MPGTLSEAMAAEQSHRLDLWEIDLTSIGGERYFFTNEVNEKGQGVIWQNRVFSAYPIIGSGFAFNGKGPANRPEIRISNLFGLVTGLLEAYEGLVGGHVVRRSVPARFLDAGNFHQGNPQADPEQECVQRYLIEQATELTREHASFTLSTPTESDGVLSPGRTMLAEICHWHYRSEECGYQGSAVADEFDAPTGDPTRDRCSKTRRACELRDNIGSYGGFLSINKLTQ